MMILDVTTDLAQGKPKESELQVISERYRLTRALKPLVDDTDAEAPEDSDHTLVQEVLYEGWDAQTSQSVLLLGVICELEPHQLYTLTETYFKKVERFEFYGIAAPIDWLLDARPGRAWLVYRAPRGVSLSSLTKQISRQTSKEALLDESSIEHTRDERTLLKIMLQLSYVLQSISWHPNCRATIRPESIYIDPTNDTLTDIFCYPHEWYYQIELVHDLTGLHHERMTYQSYECSVEFDPMSGPPMPDLSYQLGVMLYQALSGQLPFTGIDRNFVINLVNHNFVPIQLSDCAREVLDEAALNDLVSLLLSPLRDSNHVWTRVIDELCHLLDEPRRSCIDLLIGRYEPIDYSDSSLSRDLFIPSRQVRITYYSEHLTSEYQRIDSYIQFINQLEPGVMLRIENYAFSPSGSLYVTQDASRGMPLFDYLERQPLNRLELSEAIEMTRSAARCYQTLLSAEPPDLIFSPQYIYMMPTSQAGSVLLDGNMIIYPLVKAIEDQHLGAKTYTRVDLFDCLCPGKYVNSFDERIFVYCLGVLLYRSLCGDFIRLSDSKPVSKAINFAKEPKPKISADVLRDALDDVTLNNLNNLIAWITSGDPEDRPKTLQLLISALNEFEEMMKRGFSSPDDMWVLQHQYAPKTPKPQRSSRSFFQRLFGWVTCDWMRGEK